MSSNFDKIYETGSFFEKHFIYELQMARDFLIFNFFNIAISCLGDYHQIEIFFFNIASK